LAKVLCCFLWNSAGFVAGVQQALARIQIFMETMMGIDFAAAIGGLRTACALLIGNSVLVYMGVLGADLDDPLIAAAKILTMGSVVLILTCLTRRKK
jgi:hypothetical protein